MPELPEVEVVRLFLEQKLLQKNIKKIEVLNPKSFIGDVNLVLNQKIIKFSRIGKQLSLYLSNNLILLVHLKMTGQLIFYPSLHRPSETEGEGGSRGVSAGQGVLLGHPTKDALSQLPSKSTRLVFHFGLPSSKGVSAGQEVLYFNDQRKFGWIRLFNRKELAKFQANLGLDIFDPLFSSQYLFQQLQRSRRPVKAVLLDQHFFAGIGNIYANDSLFLAGIHPQIPSNKITLKQAKSIHKYLIKIMKQSVLAGGSTAKDNKYIKPDNTFGKNQFFFRVYQRAGESCLKCASKIEYFKLAGRGTFFCPSCQKI